LLHATNTVLHKTIVQGITITELAESESNSEEKESLNNPTESFPKSPKKENQSKRLVSVLIFLVIVAMIIWMIFN